MVMDRYILEITHALNQVNQFGLTFDKPVEPKELEIPKDLSFGDFALPCFKLAKLNKSSPQKISEKIVDALVALAKAKGSHSKFEAKAYGPYVNFMIPSHIVIPEILSDILEGENIGHYGQLSPSTRGTWVIEFSSPNIAKPLNIYHLRPTALGAALDRIGRFRGYHMVSINHLGDWGRQYGLLSVAFRREGRAFDESVTMNELVDFYVKINQVAKQEPEIFEQARQDFLDLERSHPQMVLLWKNCVSVSMTEFNRIYQRLGVKFDHVWGESFYKDLLNGLIEKLKSMSLLEKSEGAWVVPVSDAQGKELPPCILLKSDGATLYHTRDLAAAIYRYEKFHFDRMTYIVGSEQKLHFQQLFAVLKKMGFQWVEKCEHVPFGLYRFKDAKMSTRDGNFIRLEEILDLTKAHVDALMQSRLSGSELADKISQNSEAVAIGAVVYNDLHTDPSRDIEFDIHRITDFEGETGPYLQYAHTRCLSILNKAKDSMIIDGGSSFTLNLTVLSELVCPEEVRLVKSLGMFSFHLEKTLQTCKASHLSSYLIDVAKNFGAFYRECKVLGENSSLTLARLQLVEATRRVLARGLGLLGIPLPDRM